MPPTPTIDPIHALLRPVDDDSEVLLNEPENADDLLLKEKTKKILYKAGPSAARRLAQVSETGDDKEAVAASTTILDRIGLAKGEMGPASGLGSALPQQALIAALLGIGRVLGIKQAGGLKDITPPIKVKYEQTSPLPSPVREPPSLPVHVRRLHRAGGGKKVEKKASGSAKAAKKAIRPAKKAKKS